jgi:hypothetical protein
MYTVKMLHARHNVFIFHYSDRHKHWAVNSAFCIECALSSETDHRLCNVDSDGLA